MAVNFLCTKTRECRANNFLGMSYGPAYDGIDFSKSVANRQNGHVVAGVDDLVGDMLVIFHEWQDGMNAALWRLKEIYFDHGINTPELIYNKWSGDKTGQNGIKLAEIMGVKPDIVLTFSFNDLKDLIHAMLRFEDSTAVFESDLINIPDAMYLEAIAYAVHKTEAVSTVAVPIPETVGNKNSEVEMTKLNIGKILTMIATGCGLIVEAVQDVQAIPLPGHWGILIALAGALATDVLHFIQQYQATVTTTTTTTAPIVKVLLIGFLLFAFSGSAFADNWIIPSLTLKPAEAGKLSLSIAGTTINGVLLPTASLGLATNQTVPSYGFTGAYDFVIGQETPVLGSSNTQLTPFIGIGGAVYVDFAPWVNSNLESPVLADFGFNLVGPEILGEVPTIAKTWNLDTGEQKTTINFTAFFDIIPTSTIIPIF